MATVEVVGTAELADSTQGVSLYSLRQAETS